MHHIEPYHIKPELELDPSNLMTLCEGRTHTCHFIFGHFYDWHRFNKDIRQDAPIWHQKFSQLDK